MFEKLGLFHTPEDWAELQDKIEAHGSGERTDAICCDGLEFSNSFI
jgi:hypothetical protein